MKCNNCGYELTEGMNACPNCGTPILDTSKKVVIDTYKAPPRTCPNCGHEVPEKANFCPNCRAALNGPRKIERTGFNDPETQKIIAIIELIAACISFFYGGLFLQIPVLIFSIVLMKQQYPPEGETKTMNKIAMILSIIGIALILIFMIISMLISLGFLINLF